ncbi:MAG: phosphatase PAP2 family protein [Candidatus Omnitrophica bacterium]|nr:phosphatase PAP2 family protein [Candidatus Omnitrophota bacterium]
MSGLTHLGDTRIIVALALLGVLESRRKAPSARRRKGPLIPWLGVGVAMGITGCLKILVTRPRPAEVYPALGLVAPDVGRSFPSGHAAGAFAVATALSLRWPRGRWLWFSLASGVALSRVALGMHWPSDAVVGALIGSGAVIGLSLGLRRWLQVE